MRCSLLLLAGTAALVAFTAGSARAAPYPVSYTTTGGDSFTGLFTTTDAADSNGYFPVTAITGQRNGFTVSLLPYNTSFGNDNLLKPALGYFDLSGVSFSANGIDVNIYNSGNDQNPVLNEIISNDYVVTSVTDFRVADVSAVPEPASWAMMILGMGAVGFAIRSAKRRSDEKFDAKIKKITYGAID